jgi:hypothetical protein
MVVLHYFLWALSVGGEVVVAPGNHVRFLIE